MGEFKFGDYVCIEQKRYRGENEFYTYKIVRGDMKSNNSRPVPVNPYDIKQMHDMEPVVLAICCGVDETKVEKFKASDVVLSTADWHDTPKRSTNHG